MLVVHVEIWPGGNPKESKRIGTAHIHNLTGLNATADYLCEFHTIDDRHGAGTEHRGRVTNHDRSQGFWQLVKAAIGCTFREK